MKGGVREERMKVKVQKDVDGGWAWVVLVATVLILTLQSSYTTSVGLFLVEFLETFSGSKGFIALIGSLAISGQTLLGPVAGILSTVLTPRVTIMAGGGLLTLGLVTASFSQDLPTLLLLFGITCGIGTGLTYSSAVTAISSYFCKYRTVANGIVLGAPGVGVIVAPFLLRWLIESYGWRFAMAAFGCFVAQTCVLASLLFPLKASSLTPSCCSRQSKAKSAPTSDHHHHHHHHHGDNDDDAESPQAPMNGNLKRLQDLRNAEIKVMVGSRTAMHVSEFGSVLLSNSVVWTVEEVKSGTFRRVKHLLSRRFMWVMCLNQTLLMAGLAIHSVLFPSYVHSIAPPHPHTTTTATATTTAYQWLPAIYTVYGVTMAVCRVAGGFIFSLIPQHMLKVFFGLQVGVALVLTLLPQYGVTLQALFVFKFLVGCTYGPTFLLVTPILIHYTGLEDLSVAFGVLMLCCGLSYVSAPPLELRVCTTLGGMMYDFFGSYRVSYYIAGAFVGAAALSLLLLLLIKDLTPQGETDPRQDALMGTGQKDSVDADADDDADGDDNGDGDGDGGGDDDVNGDGEEIGSREKPAVNGGVHVIDDVEDLCKFINNRHS